MSLQTSSTQRRLLTLAAPPAAALAAYLLWTILAPSPSSHHEGRAPASTGLLPARPVLPTGTGSRAGEQEEEGRSRPGDRPGAGSRISQTLPLPDTPHRLHAGAGSHPLQPKGTVPPHIILGCGLPGRIVTGGAPRRVKLTRPADVAVHRSGTVVVLDEFQILEVSPDGSQVMPLIGQERPGFSTDGTPARDAFLLRPTDIAINASGRLFVVDGTAIRFVDNTESLQTLAGNPKPGNPGESSPFANLRGLCFDDRNQAFTCDTDRHRVYRVGPDGHVDPVAGTGRKGSGGDGGQALEASLNSPTDVAVASDGSLYIAEQGGNAIRRVAPDGIITSLFAPGKEVPSGGSQSTSLATSRAVSGLNRPDRLLLLPDNSLLVTDMSAFIRRITQDGTVTVAAGREVRAMRGLSTVLDANVFACPRGIALDGDDLLVADSGHYVVKRIPAPRSGKDAE